MTQRKSGQPPKRASTRTETATATGQGELVYRIRENQEELYGPQADPRIAGTIHGGYFAGRIDREGHFHRGRCDIALAGLHSPEDFRRTLRHELLGRFALNTFTPEEKRTALAALASTCSRDPSAQFLMANNTQRVPFDKKGNRLKELSQ